MTREEFAEIFPEEPPPWSVIVWKNVSDTEQSLIFSLSKVGNRARWTWAEGSRECSWDDVPNTFCHPHIVLVDYFFSE